MRRLIRWAVDDIRSGADTDLWILVAAALAFTMLGFFGVADARLLSSVVLALLAVLAVSQIRSRKDLAETLALQHRTRMSVLHSDFPSSYYELRDRLDASYLFVGTTMGRTLATGRPTLESLLQKGGHVRVVLPDPKNNELMRMIARTHRHDDSPDRIRSQVSSTLDTLSAMATQTGGRLDIRVLDVPLRVGMNGLDVELPTGAIMVQHYEFEPRSESAPILLLRAAQDEPWYSHFVAEAERIWDGATTWP